MIVFFILIAFYSFHRRRWNHITVLRTCCVFLAYLYSLLVYLHFYIIYTSLFTLYVTGFLWLHFFFSGPHCTSSFNFVTSQIKFPLLCDIDMNTLSYDEVYIRNSCLHKNLHAKGTAFLLLLQSNFLVLLILIKIYLLSVIPFLNVIWFFLHDILYTNHSAQFFFVNIMHIASYFQYNFAILPLLFFSFFFSCCKNQKWWHDALLVHYWDSLLCFFPS